MLIRSYCKLLFRCPTSSWFAVQQQAGKAAVSGGSLATEMLVSSVPGLLQDPSESKHHQARSPGYHAWGMSLLSAVQDTAAPQTQKCSSASAFHMQDRQEAIIKAAVSIRTGEKKHEMENFSTFSIFCSQPLQVLLLDLAYSAAKSFRLFSALPPPSWSPPFPVAQSKYRVRLYYTFSYPLSQTVSSLH